MDTQIPESIDKYQIIKLLGSGATSNVYLAYDAFSERKVAIKLIKHAALYDPEHGRTFRKLLATEASLAGRLNHPHIMAIYDAVMGPEKNYLVLEYVQGESLEKYCQPDSLLPVEKVVEIIFKCAMALDYACKNGVIHRDIKPANIMLCQDGDVKIADFGAAVLTRNDQTQLLGIGSPLYMSPEQITLDSITHQTDIYSLGVVLYRLLTGHLPFEAENSYALTQKILNEQALEMRTFRPALPPQLEQIVSRAMHKKLQSRYANWMEFSKDLAAVAHINVATEYVSETEKFNSMKRLKFFEGFSDVELWEVLRISVWGRVPAGTCLVQEGDEGNYFFIIADGEVEVSKSGKSLGMHGAGSCFGEMCYIRKDATRRSATVVAQTPVTLIKIKAASLRNASEACQLRFDGAFLDILVDRLSRADAELVRL